PAPRLARAEGDVAPQRAMTQLGVAPPGDHARQVGATEPPEPHLLADQRAHSHADRHGKKNRRPARWSSPACARMSCARPGFNPTSTSLTSAGISRGWTTGRPRCALPALNGL